MQRNTLELQAPEQESNLPCRRFAGPPRSPKGLIESWLVLSSRHTSEVRLALCSFDNWPRFPTLATRLAWVCTVIVFNASGS